MLHEDCIAAIHDVNSEVIVEVEGEATYCSVESSHTESLGQDQLSRG